MSHQQLVRGIVRVLSSMDLIICDRLRMLGHEMEKYGQELVSSGLLPCLIEINVFWSAVQVWVKMVRVQAGDWEELLTVSFSFRQRIFTGHQFSAKYWRYDKERDRQGPYLPDVYYI